MVIDLSVVLLVVGLVCFVVAAAGLVVGRINLVAAGLACWVLALLLGAGLR